MLGKYSASQSQLSGRHVSGPLQQMSKNCVCSTYNDLERPTDVFFGINSKDENILRLFYTVYLKVYWLMSFLPHSLLNMWYFNTKTYHWNKWSITHTKPHKWIHDRNIHWITASANTFIQKQQLLVFSVEDDSPTLSPAVISLAASPEDHYSFSLLHLKPYVLLTLANFHLCGFVWFLHLFRFPHPLSVIPPTLLFPLFWYNLNSKGLSNYGEFLLIYLPGSIARWASFNCLKVSMFCFFSLGSYRYL